MPLEEAERLADRSLRGWIDRGRAVGVMVGLSAGDDVVMKAFGSSGTGRALGPDTVVEIGSITKTFTGLLLAEMAGRGEVRLEDPIGRYLPFRPPRGDREVTLLDLATHTARLPRSGAVLVRQFWRNRLEPFAAFTVEDLYATVFSARVGRGLGRKMRYSNIGFGLLGHILGLGVGRPYEGLVVERVCAPLGLSDTGPAMPADGRAARGHRRGGRPVPPLRIPTLGGAGALRSTVVDMLAYLRAHLHPGRTPLPEAIVTAVGPHRTFKRGRVAIGLGWLHLRRGGRTVVFHDGGTVGFGSMIAFDPRRDTAVVLLSNSRYLLRTGRVGLGLLEALAG